VKDDEETSDPPVAVVEGVQGLLLVMRHRRGNHWVDAACVVRAQPLDEVFQT
jgi:hypothetical protein